jgi:L-gulonate 3-dehydrogenase
MHEPTFKSVAVIGTGVIGRSWIRVFARAGCETRGFDPDDERLARAFEGTPPSARACATLDEALAGAEWVQESGPEALATKRSLYAELDATAPPTAILASSTSTHDMSRIAEGLDGASRCIVAHPVNPPHVVPVVEVLPGERTDPETVAAALAFMTSVGQSPVEMNHYLPGFLLNRMQAALVREAVFLIGSGAATADAIDTVIRDGLGLRWALMGPFGTAHTNADGGAGDYLERYGDAYRALWADLEADPDFDASVIEQVHDGMVDLYGPDSTAALSEWRDRSVRRIRDMKKEDPPPTRAEAAR